MNLFDLKVTKIVFLCGLTYINDDFIIIITIILINDMF